MIAISWSTESRELEGEDLTLLSTDHELRFDVVTRVVHDGTSVLTERAVEDGAPISDHKRANPKRITIEAVVSNTPLDVPPPSGYGDSSTISITKSEEDGASVNVFSADFDRIEEVSSTLERLRLEATSVAISTRSRTYDAMQLIPVSEPTEVEDGDSAKFTLEFQQIRIARTRSVDAPAPREPRGQLPQETGSQEGEDASRGQNASWGRETLDDYNRRREAGEGRWDAARNAAGTALGGG